MGYGADLRFSAAVSQFSTFSISSFPPPALADSAPSVLFVAARRLQARGLDPSRHFAPFAVKNALVDRSIRSELKTYPLKLKPKLRAPVSQFLLFRRLPWPILRLLSFL
jgi:hypothetical protein